MRSPAEKIAYHRHQTRWAWWGLALQPIAVLVMGSLNELDAMSLRGILGVSLFLLSLGCMNIGIWHYAKAKGYSNWVAALGCFNVYGLIVLLILPRRNP